MIDYNSVISKRVQSIQPSGIRKFFDILENMTDAISLGVGEPDFPTPWHIRDAGIYSLEKGFTKYTSNAGMADLRREICNYLDRRFDLHYDPDTQVLVTVGGSEGIDCAIRCITDPGDEVLIPEPSFVCYGPMVSLASGVPVAIPLVADNEFRVSPEQLLSVVTDKTKAIVLPYPSNPTGGIMQREDLEAIAPILKERGIIVISDEIYAELTYEGKHVSMANLPGMYEQTLVVNGMSKSYSMTGWRLGYVCGPAPLIRQMTKIHQYAIMSAPTTSQHAAVEALRNGDEDIERMKEEYDGRRRFLVNGLRELGLDCFEPRGAFYVFPCIRSTGLSSEEFCERLLVEQKVACIAGNAFGQSGEGFVRMCYAASMHDLQEALRRIGLFLDSLK
ncbi:MAG: aminotransferase class I/II-fold pyridoxal phosphate-dependent enzyme [Oscillospiraceae bacterium]|nr:aminotransferase class I/II-fold pyridoxal phosphate-dependent enzyme [Oscillospiraceae bacterium]